MIFFFWIKYFFIFVTFRDAVHPVLKERIKCQFLGFDNIDESYPRKYKRMKILFLILIFLICIGFDFFFIIMESIIFYIFFCKNNLSWLLKSTVIPLLKSVLVWTNFILSYLLYTRSSKNHIPTFSFGNMFKFREKKSKICAQSI